MKVFTIDDNMYEVRIDPNRWATVASTPEGWHIVNQALHVISSDGALGKSLIKAVEEYVKEATS